MVKEVDAAHLDINRYEKLKIYSKVTGKTMYKEYDKLLMEYESKVHQKISQKLKIFLEKKKVTGSLN